MKISTNLTIVCSVTTNEQEKLASDALKMIQGQTATPDNTCRKRFLFLIKMVQCRSQIIMSLRNCAFLRIFDIIRNLDLQHLTESGLSTPQKCICILGLLLQSGQWIPEDSS